MALATSAFTTYAAVGNREDLSNRISRIDPTNTPFFSGIDRESATATNHEWQTQALAAASNSNFQFEGDDNPTADAAIPTVRLGNYAQIQVKIPRVTGTQEVVEHAGRDSEMDFQSMLKGMELRRDVETTFVGTNQAKVAGSAGAVRKLASVLSWITSNTNIGTGAAANPTSADGLGVRVDGTQRAFTEAQVKDVIKKCFDAGGEPDTIMTGSFNKQAFSTFTGRGTPTQDQATKTLTSVVDTYISDFGRFKVVPNRFMRSRDCLVLQMDMWAKAALPGRNFISFPLAKTGDSERKEILVEHTLVAKNEKASGGIFDLTSS